MSTTFGIEILKEKSQDGKRKIIKVARRVGRIYWINDLAVLLPDETIVIPLDNSAQGIYTIRDIKDAINKQEK